ncbi:MAG: NUDIX domain-containing protein [Reyranella sp.]|uniref:NUDIX hydrolase n=1 Tax=Reyranella sp. TaxID=1929291 RepID=UPI001AD49A3A|nr:NUDIX domain-containing protein [Reyranella sp.]MBN9090591.1 NUDIX domain-containing protein [Reyranella sp.]
MAKHRLITDLHLILRDGGRVLLGLRQNTGFSDGLYHLPAGHLEPDETIVAGAAREAKEELGIDIAPGDLDLVHTMHLREERLSLFFEVRGWSGEISNAEPDKCAALAWFPFDGFPENFVAYARAALERIRDGQRVSTFGWE